MENNQPFNNYDRLLIEYIRLLDSTNNTTRTAQTSFLTILHSYLNTLNSQLERQHTTNANVRSLLQRYFENFRTQQYENRNADRIRQRHNQNLRRRNNIWNLNNNTGDSYSLRQNNVIPNSTTNTTTNTNTGSTLFSDPFFSRRSTERPFSFNFSNTENTNTTSNTLRRNRPSDLFNTRNTRRRHTGTSPINPFRSRTLPRTTIDRNAFQRLIHETLYIPTNPSPITRERVDQVTARLLWSDIVETSDQMICPITRERFLNNHHVLRIIPCGHIFNEEALITYLTEYDYRCPVCRHDLRNAENTESTTDTTTTDASTQPDTNDTPLRDDIRPIASFTFAVPTLPSLNNLSSTNNSTDSLNNFSFDISNNILTGSSTNTVFDISTNIIREAASNSLQNIMTDVVTELTSALNDSALLNNNNNISAEYSFLIPPNTNNQSTSTRETDTQTENLNTDPDTTNEPSSNEETSSSTTSENNEDGENTNNSILNDPSQNLHLE